MLKPLDQGIIAFMKHAYTQYMMAELMTVMKASSKITEWAASSQFFMWC